MDTQFSAFSHAIGALLFLILSIYSFRHITKKGFYRSIFVASVASTVWLCVLFAQSLDLDIPFHVRYTLELIRYAAWFDVLYALLGVSFVPNRKQGTDRFFLSASILGLLAVMFATIITQGISGTKIISGHTNLLLHVSIAIAGILLIEQVWRNSSSHNRISIKHLTLAIGILFTFDFFMYSDALLFLEISAPIWDARGTINAIAVPFIAFAMSEKHRDGLNVNISRQMLFHSTTLILAGIYLLIISAGGYYISVFGSTWGEALRILFIFAGLIILYLLLSSPTLRAKIMVFISKNFFDYKYDYRDEWIKSTNALSQTHEYKNLAQQVIKILADLVNSRSGAIWIRNEENDFIAHAQKNLEDVKFTSIDANSDLVNFFKNQDWIINLEEYMLDPSKYHLIEIPETILQQEHPWLIIPLGANENITGLVLLCDPITQMDLNWENYDLLKIVSQQACSYIVQGTSQEKLSTARQFEAVNKASAFLVHDIKTIIAQLSLLVKNAEKHKSNPAFVDDMIRTTSHTVEKMGHLLQQIYNPTQDSSDEDIDLNEVLLDIYQSQRKATPAPTLESIDNIIYVKADKEQLRSAIGHIVQNAIDATEKDGEVSIASKTSNDYIYLFIQDSGRGMSEEFIQNDLFKPFSSTKGLTGMGIGVYQSREYLRKLGGTINVTSQLGLGTCFTLKIPISST